MTHQRIYRTSDNNVQMGLYEILLSNIYFWVEPEWYYTAYKITLNHDLIGEKSINMPYSLTRVAR